MGNQEERGLEPESGSAVWVGSERGLIDSRGEEERRSEEDLFSLADAASTPLSFHLSPPLKGLGPR